jgi:hypothetical protein
MGDEVARGGYIKPSVALKRLFIVTISRSEAIRILAETLACGAVEAQGRSIQDWKTASSADLDGADVPDLLAGQELDMNLFMSEVKALVEASETSAPPKPVLAKRGRIPTSFWTSILQHGCEDAIWERGEFPHPSSHDDGVWGYMEVTFKEEGINRLVATIPPLAAARRTEDVERGRRAPWNDWVAAVAVLAHEQLIGPTTSHNDLIDLVNSRLKRWDLDPKQKSKVVNTAMAIVRRFETDPPVQPLTVRNEKR